MKIYSICLSWFFTLREQFYEERVYTHLVGGGDESWSTSDEALLLPLLLSDISLDPGNPNLRLRRISSFSSDIFENIY